MRSLTEHEQAEIASALAMGRDRLLFLFGIYTGFRIHELLSIRLQDVWRDYKAAPAVTVARRRLKGGAGVKSLKGARGRSRAKRQGRANGVAGKAAKGSARRARSTRAKSVSAK